MYEDKKSTLIFWSSGGIMPGSTQN
jgi:hypothetical protein